MPKFIRPKDSRYAQLSFLPEEQETMNKTLAWLTSKKQGGRIARVDRRNLTFNFEAPDIVYDAIDRRIQQLSESISPDSLQPPDQIIQRVNPLLGLKPLNEKVAYHMKKDIAMADEATQFIGKSSAPPQTPSSTRNYEIAWGDRANTGIYSPEDVIMISGSGPWRGVTQRMIDDSFQQHYIPLLDKALDAKSSFVVGGAAGIDTLARKYLSELKHTPKQGYARFDFY